MSLAPRRLAPIAALSVVAAVSGPAGAVVTPILVPVGINAMGDTTVASTIAPNGDGHPMSLAVVPAGYKGTPLAGGDVVVSDVSNSAGVKGRGKSIVRIHKGVTTKFSTSVVAPVGLSFNNTGTQLWAAGFGTSDNGSHGSISVLKTQTTSTAVAGTAYAKGVIANSHGPWGLASNHSSTSPLYFWVNVDGTLVRDSKIGSPYATSTSTKNVHVTLATFAHAAAPSLSGGTISAPQGMVWDSVTATLFVANEALDQIVAIHTAGTATGTAVVTLVAAGGPLHQPRAIAIDRNTDDLLVTNGGVDNNLVELTQTGHVVATRDLDPVDQPGSITGMTTAKDASGQTEIYYLNARTNTLHLLSASSSPITLSAPPSTNVPYWQPVVIRGNAPAGATVQLYFQRRAVPGYVLRRTLQADGFGGFVTTFAPNDDYSYYAMVGAKTSAVVSVQVLPTLLGPATRTARRGAAIMLHGHAAPHSIVTLHFHKAGTPASDFSLIRLVHGDVAGNWHKLVRLSVAYRMYATRGALHPYSQQVHLKPH